MQIVYVGATIGRLPELWFNHNFNICFDMKNHWLTDKIIYKP